MIVDSSVVMVENCVRHLAKGSGSRVEGLEPEESQGLRVEGPEPETHFSRPSPSTLVPRPSSDARLSVIRDAAVEVRKPTMFGELIIMIVYLPILTLEGIEGKLFRPMALDGDLRARLGSMVLSLTLMPVLASLVLPKRIDERSRC